MISTYKVLGQQATVSTTDTTLYTVPALTSTIVSTITVCNRGATNGTFRIAVRPAGATLANNHYLYYDNLITANETISLTIGLTLATTDVITVYASNANMTFSAFGTELTP